MRIEGEYVFRKAKHILTPQAWLIVYSIQDFIKSQKSDHKRINNVIKKTNKMNVLGFDQDHIKQKISPFQIETLKILLYLISVQKIVQISKLS